MVRPIVLVFQEFAQQTVTPTTPDLNCLIIGPAYQILDYIDDKDQLQVSDYGTLNADNPYTPPVPFVPAITLAAPPSIETGAWVTPDSIKVYFDDVRVIMADGADGSVAAADNLITSAGQDFVAAGVRPGDTVIIDDPAGPTPNLVRTVISVDSATEIRVTTDFTATNTNLSYRVERRLNDQLIDSSFVDAPVFRSSNEININGGVTLTVGGLPRTVSYAKVYVAYVAYRTDLQNLDTVESTSQIITKIGKIDSRNPLAAACQVALLNAGQSPVQFYGVDSDDLIGYSLAKDVLSTNDSIYAIVPLTTDISVIAAFKADNESLADPTVALSTGVPQKFRMVIGSGELPLTKDVVAETVSGTAEQKVGAAAPGVKRIALSSLNALGTISQPPLKPGDRLVLTASENAAPIDGTYTVAHINSNTVLELNEALPATIAAAEGVNYTVVRPSTGATVVPLVDNRGFLTTEAVTYYSKVAGVTPSARTICKIDNATTPNGIDSVVETYIGTPTTTIYGDFSSGNITAQMIVDALTTGAGVTASFSGSLNLVATTSSGATVQTNDVGAGADTPIALSTGTPGVDDVTTGLLDDVYIRLYDAAAQFITAGVLPGDLIQVPTDPDGVFGLTYKTFVVNSVLSEQRLEIENISGGLYQNNTSVLENELPHTDNRLGLGQLVTYPIRYRVARTLTKTQQVTTLAAQAQSLNSRRAILAWPDRVTVAGLVDGSKPRNTDGSKAPADPQPGYFMSAVIGGMTAGLPSHQGFSRLGCAGITRIYDSSDYFSEAQITDLSDSGWYVFIQNAPTALPYSVHQLTTDPATLESGEYSIVKNFDFVSIFFAGILEPFLGVWNVNNDTLGFIRQALNTGIANLKLRRVARIGAPINEATITSVAVSPASADRVEVYMAVDLPKPLNVIGLHLVA